MLQNSELIDKLVKKRLEQLKEELKTSSARYFLTEDIVRKQQYLSESHEISGRIKEIRNLISMAEKYKDIKEAMDSNDSENIDKPYTGEPEKKQIVSTKK